MKNLLISALLLTLTGCVSMGTQVSDENMSALKKGVTTESEVQAKLGQPNAISKLSDGKKIYVYSYVHASPTAASFIPVVGIFAGGSNAQSTSVTLTFNQVGILQDYSSTQTQTSGGMGMASTAYQQPSASQ
jgi:outer membrane protein assembly factor BamE (lipoprotein component of BamABCDE complex)